MCECIAQFSPPDSYLDCLTNGAAMEPEIPWLGDNNGARACPDLRDHEHIIRPNHRLSAVLNIDGRLRCHRIRWGWSPIWSMGVRSPLTHLPLQIVMRSKVFKRMRDSGRAVVAVDGWFDLTLDGTTTGGGRFAYRRAKGAGPTYLAALAQFSEARSGCDGLVLVTNGGGGALGPLHLLTLDRHLAMRWLDPSVDWQQAFPLLSEGFDMNEHFETVPVRQRFNLRR